MRLRTLFTIQIMFLFLSGCSTDSLAQMDTPTGSEISTSLHTTSTPPATDIVIAPSQFSRTIELNVGQIFQIESPSQNETWQVDYDPVLFEPLTPPEEIQSPGPAGWRFKAVVPGEGQIVLVSIVECANPPCPLMPIRFQINFKVK